MLAALAVLALLGIAGWWVWWGGLSGRLVNWDRAPRQTVRFQVDVNSAGAAELAQLPDIGPTLAARIIDSRQTEGPFRSHDDLRRVHGIGAKTLEEIRPYLAPIEGNN